MDYLFKRISRPPSRPTNVSTEEMVVRAFRDATEPAELQAVQDWARAPEAVETERLVVETDMFDIARRFLDSENQKVSVKLYASDRDGDAFRQYHDVLSNRRVQLEVSEIHGALLALNRTLQELGLRRVNIGLDALLAADEDDLHETVRELLFSEQSQAPIQPFFHLLRYSLTRPRNAVSLWDAQHERLGDAFITDDGQVTLSSRWADAGLYFGDETVLDTGLEGTALFRQMERYEFTLFQTKAPCSFCEAYPVCRGFIKAVDPERDCSNFIQAFNELKDHATSIKAIIGEMPTHDRAALESEYLLRQAGRNRG